MTPDNTRELIAEATAHIKYTTDSIGPEGSEVRAAWARGEGSDARFALVVRLRDALAALTSPQEGDARERIAREAYRELYPGPINTPDSNRTRESDLAEMDSAYAIWDGGHEGFAPGIICRRVADRILAAFPVLSRAAPAEPPHIPYPGEPFDPRHAHDWADNACQSPGCMARPDGTTQTLSVRRTRKGS